MPTPLNNQASIRYNYSGAGTGTAVSNTVTTNLLDRYTLAATKTPLSSTFRPGENVTYVIRVENNGSGDLYNVTIADDLGGGADTPLVYNPASLRAYVDSIPVTISPVVQGGTLTAVLPAPLPAGTAAILVYTAQVRPDVDFTLQSITNTVAVTANGGSAAGPAVTVTPSPTATLLRDSYAEVTLYKEADKQSVMAGEPLTYTFTLTNQGNQAADSVTLTDQLPTGFSVTQVSVSAGGATTVLAPGDYTVAADNTITIPSTTGKAITVPAATVAAPGIATVAITGTVAGVTP
ncbi:MAG: DUF11 domain-containing protein [Angelakisella sp.]|jgi:uncharacterized repeat protein (TIGR01451 family)|nr:DUF11 domain-containing protein [Angelakisella sp.]MCI9667346.1 DUF11 domain-containing protein [Angelakisella sp.]